MYQCINAVHIRTSLRCRHESPFSGQSAESLHTDPLRSSSPSNPYPLLLHPSTSALVLPSSHPSTLQWVDTAQSSVLFDLEVAPSNRVTRRDEKELEGVAVEKVAFSEAVNGQSEWMATVEGRQGDEYEGSGGVRVLKVWRWDGERYVILCSTGVAPEKCKGIKGKGARLSDRYMVNTTQPRPHGLNRITALAFSHVEKEGERPLLLTADESGGVKTWMIRQSRKSEHGQCFSTTYLPLISASACRQAHRGSNTTHAQTHPHPHTPPT